jgi:hypothetical protein
MKRERNLKEIFKNKRKPMTKENQMQDVSPFLYLVIQRIVVHKINLQPDEDFE